ncbi:aminotransferase [Castellaniella sp.]|uniref:aminotransferase n=1 Tax=Castellaniella sp. TaxID=1955812 RepID=UPI003561492C
MTKSAEELLEIDRKYFMHPSTHAHDHETGALPGRLVTSARGIRIRDHRGETFIDGFAGLYCVNIGYGRTEVAEAMYEQARRLAYYHTYVGHTTDVVAELSRRIMEWAPEGMKKVYFGLSGSDANETQIKIVWYYNNILGRRNKKKIISREGGYHGSSIAAGSLTGLASFHRHFDLPLERMKHTVRPHWYRNAPEGLDEAAFSRYCAEQLEALILSEGPDTVAAFIGEPVLGTGGIVPPPKGYWSAIQAVLDKYDILLIADEVVCGFGRLGSPMGSQKYGIRPDLITIAKGLTSAYAPLSGVIVGDKVWDVIVSGSRTEGAMGHGWTYSGHPVSAAAALANLDILESENIPAQAASVGAYLQASLQAAFAAHPLVGEVRGAGMLAALEFMADPVRRVPFDKDVKVGSRVAAACMQRHLIARAMPDHDVLGFAPPLVTTREDVDEIVRITREAVDAVATEIT